MASPLHPTGPSAGDADDTPSGPPFGPYGPGGDMALPSEVRAREQREAASATRTARAGRAVRQRVTELFGAGGPAFATLANAHAASTAGDTLIAVALANSLFFQVPSSEARGNVALYLLLTVAPFAVIGPLLGRVFDREGAERGALIGSSLIRVVAAGLLVALADTFWLFPLAFTLLVLSRVHGISRSALLPQALSTPIALVTANARLAQISVIGGAVAAPIGAGLALIGSEPVLIAAGAAFAAATWQSFALPTLEEAEDAEAARAAADDAAGDGLAPLPLMTPTPRTAGLGAVLGVTPDGDADAPDHGDDPTPPDQSARPSGVDGPFQGVAPGTPTQLRLARFATAVVRLLNGYLVLILAFAFRDVDAPLADFGAVLAAAGIGYGLAAVAAPVLERALREEPMVVAALAVEAAAAFITGQFFSLATAALLSLAAGYAWGTAKFAFDGLLQATVEPAQRGRAFTRSETVFQLAWVLGAFIPTGIAVDVRIGLIVAGVTALFAQTIYVARLLQRHV